MLHALTWFAVLVLLALWSLADWFMHALGAWAVSSAGTIAQAATRDPASPLPDWLATWIPADVVETLASLVSSFASLFPNMSDVGLAVTHGLTVAAWVVWTLGSLVLLGGGLLAHWLQARWRGRAALPVRPTASPMPN